KWIGPDDLAIEILPQQPAAIDDEGMREPVSFAGVRHVFEVSIGVRVGQRPMLAPPLDVVAALDVVQAAIRPPIRPRIQPPLIVELDAERIAATFGEDFEAVLLRLIAPNAL